MRIAAWLTGAVVLVVAALVTRTALDPGEGSTAGIGLLLFPLAGVVAIVLIWLPVLAWQTGKGLRSLRDGR